MLDRQQQWQHLMIIGLIVVFGALIVNLWLIRSTNQSQQFYYSKSQSLMAAALKVEGKMASYEQGQLSQSELLDSQVIIDRLISDVKKQANVESGSQWKDTIQAQIKALENSWVKDKQYLEKIQLGRGIVVEQINQIDNYAYTLEAFKKSYVAQMEPVETNKQKINYVIESIDRWIDELKRAQSVPGKELNWHLWDIADKSIKRSLDSIQGDPLLRRTGNHQVRGLIKELEEITLEADNLKASYLTTDKLEGDTSIYQSDLFQNASRLAIALLEKPRQPFTSSSISISLVVLLMLLNLFLHRMQKRFQDDLVAKIKEDKEKVERDLQLFTHEASNMIDGNLNVEFSVSDGMTKELAQTMNQAVKSIDTMIRKVISQIRKIQHDTTSASEKFTQAQSLLQKEDKVLNAAIDNMNNVSSVLIKTSKQSKSALSDAEKTVQTAHQNVLRIRDALSQAGGFGNKIIELRQKIANLNQHHEKIQENISAVEDATEQTVTLALNAAIQAAVSNQGGQGFAIVATEMQDLADQIEETMNDITHHLHELGKGMSSIGLSIEDSTEVIQGEIVLTKETSQCLSDIEHSAAQLESVLNKVARATEIEGKEASTVAKNSEELTEGMHSLGGSLEQIRVSLESIAVDSNRLSDDVNTFVLWEDNHAK